MDFAEELSMRFFLVSVLLVTMTSAPRADDLADLPELACALTSTLLERQQIGCPDDTSRTAAQLSRDKVQFAQPDDAAND
ncbi:hypothetical protein MKK84_05435 [Methylobacterium sp. E-065]|uniref:hypothetical protein n=1 Tax=Methylobacterium sp. E-065 TaxID=2836583 RepID=UPI001FB986CC|nr:hypothetical protein [Methylobacterium sp. E-065]MCJ2016875.1 hypothetical protein [Methylobacterium sp. E-065]